jgi:hypothetical protein
VPLNALAALVLLMMFVEGVPGSREPTPSAYSDSAPGLWQDGEREIRDIRPVDAGGNPLTDVYLFDQDGMPIDTSGGGECSGSDGMDPGSNAAYPRGTWDYDPRTGRCRHTPPGPLVVAVPTTPAPGAATATTLPTQEPAPPVVSVPPAPPTTPLATPPVTAPAAPPTR